jgi:23S rRNA maturation-related 3'-5' exoribonuclease YhaM
MNPIHRGKVEKGKLILEDPSRYLLRIASLEGKKVELSLKKSQSIRSLQQNKFYHGVVVKMIANHCGYIPDEMHEILKHKFLSDNIADEFGLVRVRSTAALSTDEFIQYTNRIVIWSAETLDLPIPDPSQVEF